MIKQGSPILLSKRLKAIADMIPEGQRLADVGCDHGFLSIYLVQTGKIPGALAMDVRKGPLAAAALHVKEAGLEKQIETRLSDGLAAFCAGEAQTLVCAGMGGPLMQRILTAYPDKTESFQDFLLQPQSEIREFRSFLRGNGYKIMEERILLEDGKYYFPTWVRRGEAPAEGELTEVFDRYGETLIRKKDPLLRQYLIQQEKVLNAIEEKLREAADPNDRSKQRMAEVTFEKKMLLKALELMEKSSESGAECLP